MTITMFLLGLVYVILIVALLAVGVNGAMVALIAVGLAVFQLFGSDKLALARDGRARGDARRRRPSCTR